MESRHTGREGICIIRSLLGARLEMFAFGLVVVHITAALAVHTHDRVVAEGLTAIEAVQADGLLVGHRDVALRFFVLVSLWLMSLQ